MKKQEQHTEIANKYFVYDGSTLIAAQPKFTTALKYLKSGRTIFKGTPCYHKTDLTKIANKLIFTECRQ